MKSTNKTRRNIKQVKSNKQAEPVNTRRKSLVSDRAKKLSFIWLAFILIGVFLVEPSDLQVYALLALGSIVIAA